jgi:transcription elongation factor SPT5
MQLIQKAYTMAERGAPLAIRSAVCHDHLKGYFYVEADKESHVSRNYYNIRLVVGASVGRWLVGSVAAGT